MSEFVEAQPEMLLGRGYDVLGNEVRQAGVVGVPMIPAGAAGGSGEWSIEIIRSRDEFAKALSIEAGASVGFAGFKASMKASFMDRCKVTSEATFCIMRLVQMNAFELLDKPRLTDEAEELLRLISQDPGKRKRFVERF